MNKKQLALYSSFIPPTSFARRARPVYVRAMSSFARGAVNFLLHGIEEHTAVLVVSERSEEIRQAIIRDLGRGVTVYKGRRGWTDAEQDILFCVVTRLEIGRVRGVVSDQDPAAFVVVHPLSDVYGGVIKKAALH